MALRSLLRLYLKSAENLKLNRSGKFIPCLVRLQKYSSVEKASNDVPVQYSTNEAAKVLIAENLKLTDKKEKVWFEPYVILASIIVFLFYFCIFREENKFDELIKGNDNYKNDTSKYIELQIKLQFCKANKLPTEEIIAKLEELKKNLNISED